MRSLRSRVRAVPAARRFAPAWVPTVRLQGALVMRMRRAIFILPLLLVLPAVAHGQDANRFVVPLSKPGQPVHLVVGLINGSISVEPHAGNEVVVEAAGDGEERPRPAKPGAGGMRRLPNRSLG